MEMAAKPRQAPAPSGIATAENQGAYQSELVRRMLRLV